MNEESNKYKIMDQTPLQASPQIPLQAAPAPALPTPLPLPSAPQSAGGGGKKKLIFGAAALLILVAGGFYFVSQSEMFKGTFSIGQEFPADQPGTVEAVATAREQFSEKCKSSLGYVDQRNPFSCVIADAGGNLNPNQLEAYRNCPKWDSSAKTCRENLPGVVGRVDRCEINENRRDCESNNRCEWINRTCKDKAAPAPAPPSGGDSTIVCSTLRTREKCDSRSECQWTARQAGALQIFACSQKQAGIIPAPAAPADATLCMGYRSDRAACERNTSCRWIEGACGVNPAIGPLPGVVIDIPLDAGIAADAGVPIPGVVVDIPLAGELTPVAKPIEVKPAGSKPEGAQPEISGPSVGPQLPPVDQDVLVALGASKDPYEIACNKFASQGASFDPVAKKCFWEAAGGRLGMNHLDELQKVCGGRLETNTHKWDPQLKLCQVKAVKTAFQTECEKVGSFDPAAVKCKIRGISEMYDEATLTEYLNCKLPSAWVPDEKLCARIETPPPADSQGPGIVVPASTPDASVTPEPEPTPAAPATSFDPRVGELDGRIFFLEGQLRGAQQNSNSAEIVRLTEEIAQLRQLLAQRGAAPTSASSSAAPAATAQVAVSAPSAADGTADEDSRKDAKKSSKSAANKRKQELLAAASGAQELEEDVEQAPSVPQAGRSVSSAPARTSQATTSALHGASIRGTTGPGMLIYPLAIIAINGLYFAARRKK